ncbi:MucR family transcriptional regulator [Paramagnetospirillum kuznetsovii]|uniref:MucR family transcriptional regulator n=1 Tax=Paramagnetospirillum kuznetsovii TaxID=2053833 RepID=A0A364NSJ9_9PROT|nr:MucR family transcriptional regulator [Paramagnetospirillum kuznetsovii]RAU20063.1 MucR family transcriptional regulator [Paramagnetospirillum kuznetsovii]
MANDKTALTAKLVAAYVGNNQVEVNDLADLIKRTYQALDGVGAPAPSESEKQAPAVSIKKSVTPDALICLDCGKKQSMLKRHLMTAHRMTVDDYRTKWNLASDYPMVAPNYASRRSELAIKSGLGRKPKSTTQDSAAGEALVKQKRQHSYPASKWSKPSD